MIKIKRERKRSLRGTNSPYLTYRPELYSSCLHVPNIQIKVCLSNSRRFVEKNCFIKLVSFP